MHHIKYPKTTLDISLTSIRKARDSPNFSSVNLTSRVIKGNGVGDSCSFRKEVRSEILGDFLVNSKTVIEFVVSFINIKK